MNEWETGDEIERAQLIGSAGFTALTLFGGAAASFIARGLAVEGEVLDASASTGSVLERGTTGSLNTQFNFFRGGLPSQMRGSLDVSDETDFTVEKLLSPEEQLNQALQQSKVYEQLESIPASSPNSAAALRAKLSGLSSAQGSTEIEKTLPNGRVRYYEKFREAKTLGPTIGSRFVTEYDPETGNVVQWNENYDQQVQVNRIHLKNINGIQINSPHFPSTLREIIEQGVSLNSILPRGGY